MKILVLSDSHSGMRFMRRCIEKLRPDQIIHLGDYYEDGESLAEENPHLVFHQVPGNCDRYRCPIGAREILLMTIGGVRMYMTHGHRHNVKFFTSSLLADARKAKVAGVLYGHTHQANCCQEEDGLWVLNPGSCGYYGGSAGIIETEEKRIQSCYILRENDLG